MRLTRYIARVLCCVLCMSPGCATTKVAPQAPMGSILARTSLPKLASDGRELSLGRLATVYYFAGPECPIARAYAPEVARLSQRDEPRGIAWIMVFSEVGITRQLVTNFQTDYALPLPSVIDSSHEFSCLLGAQTIPSVVVVDSNGTLLYRGRIDNRYQALGLSYGPPTERDLAAVVDAIASGSPLPPCETPAIGCLLPPCNK